MSIYRKIYRFHAESMTKGTKKKTRGKNNFFLLLGTGCSVLWEGTGGRPLPQHKRSITVIAEYTVVTHIQEYYISLLMFLSRKILSSLQNFSFIFGVEVF